MLSSSLAVRLWQIIMIDYVSKENYTACVFDTSEYFNDDYLLPNLEYLFFEEINFFHT